MDQLRQAMTEAGFSQKQMDFFEEWMAVSNHTYRVVDTDNYSNDCPDESFASEVVTLEEAEKTAERLNVSRIDHDRWYKVVKEGYQLSTRNFKP